jgi:hypothetical protein
VEYMAFSNPNPGLLNLRSSSNVVFGYQPCGLEGATGEERPV